MFKNLNFEIGKNYRLKFKRTTIDYINETDNFYTVLKYKNGVKPSDGPWVLHKDLAISMYMYAGFPKDSKGIKIICIDNGEIIFDGDAQEKNNI